MICPSISDNPIKIIMFIDDTKIFLVINPHSDCIRLQ